MRNLLLSTNLFVLVVASSPIVANANTQTAEAMTHKSVSMVADGVQGMRKPLVVLADGVQGMRKPLVAAADGVQGMRKPLSA